MGKIERAIEAIEALPEHRREELAETLAQTPYRSALTEEQLNEVRHRRESGFKPGDASRIDQLLARLA